MTFIPDYDFFLRVVRGLVPGHNYVNKFGRNDNIAVGGEDIWMGGDIYTGHPLNTPETIEVISGSGNDASGGTGMTAIRIFGLKTATSTLYESEDLVMNGAGGVDSATTWYRVNRAKGLTYGAGGTNAGLITIRQKTTTANIFATVEIGKGQTQVCASTIPFGTTGYMVRATAKMVRANNQAGSAEMSFRSREDGMGGYNAVDNAEITNSQGGDAIFILPDEFPALADIKMTAESVSNAATIITGRFSMLFIDN